MIYAESRQTPRIAKNSLLSDFSLSAPSRLAMDDGDLAPQSQYGAFRDLVIEEKRDLCTLDIDLHAYERDSKAW